MGLKQVKSIIIDGKDTGSVIEYWKIGQQIIDDINESLIVILFGYVDKSKKDSGFFHITTESVILNSIVDSLNIKDGTYTKEDIYIKIKTKNDWSSATDVLES